MDLLVNLNKLKTAYSRHIQDIFHHEIVWKDGTPMPLDPLLPLETLTSKLDNPSLKDQLMQPPYPAGKLSDEALAALSEDPGRIRHQPFFNKMYGDTQESVKANLITIPWMPEIFPGSYYLKITSSNNVDKKLQMISSELSKLPTDYHKFLSVPESFAWRAIAGTHRLSPHSLGIAIDINIEHSHYWQWDLKAANKPVREDTPLVYRNEIPWEIILIFEKYGFIWGGKWHHYDTMHFEYRPELINN
jgi:peptidoglycan L-alanyl-D-glutamate endopeptidase CwlK